MIDFNRELTPLQRQRIGRLLRYGHDAKEIAKRVSTTARLVEAYKVERWEVKQRTKGKGGKFPSDGKRSSAYTALDRVILTANAELLEVEAVVGLVLCTIDRRCLVEFPTGLGWWHENQLLSAPAMDSILSRCKQFRENWPENDQRLIRQKRAAQVSVREWRGMYVDTEL